ncbi:uncharacterized protein BDR25DRAFT_378761 [Lindgomyces ingoldianus]|uniref:Uncharacterized protein n=1 Tax=Lindgomyces ingoldianus TaxID=673940 RepID=A0ACB6QG85_9PLEO|nr:uncharacterized protein BDR25DRAFT_378761 [Lindgomyces ingoldianus]KAF2465578.1 hypothetical protein BDR25DRAFT_378761 [Lindgomyces ingoldianus]
MAWTTNGVTLSHHTSLIPSPLRIRKRHQRAVLNRRRAERTSSVESIRFAVAQALEDISSTGWDTSPDSLLELTFQQQSVPSGAGFSWDLHTLPLSRTPSFEPLRIRKTRCSQSTMSGSSARDAWASGSRTTSQSTSMSQGLGPAFHYKYIPTSGGANQSLSSSQDTGSNFEPSPLPSSAATRQRQPSSQDLESNLRPTSFWPSRVMSQNGLKRDGLSSSVGRYFGSSFGSPHTRPSTPELSESPVTWSRVDRRHDSSTTLESSAAKLALEEIREEIEREIVLQGTPKQVKRQPSRMSIFRHRCSRTHDTEPPKRVVSEGVATNRLPARRRPSIFQRRGRDPQAHPDKVFASDQPSTETFTIGASAATLTMGSSGGTFASCNEAHFKLQQPEKKVPTAEATHLPSTTSLEIAVEIEAVLHNPHVLPYDGIDIIFVIDNAYYVSESCLQQAKMTMLGALKHTRHTDQIGLFTTHKTNSQDKEAFFPNELYPLQPVKESVLRDKLKEIQFYERSRPEGTLHRTLSSIVKAHKNPGSATCDKLFKTYQHFRFHHLNPAMRAFNTGGSRESAMCGRACDHAIASLFNNARHHDPVDELSNVTINLAPLGGCRIKVDDGSPSIPRLGVGEVHTYFATVNLDVSHGEGPLVGFKAGFRSSLHPSDDWLESNGLALSMQKLKGVGHPRELERDMAVEYVRRRFFWEMSRTPSSSAPLALKNWISSWKGSNIWYIVAGMVTQVFVELELENKYIA